MKSMILGWLAAGIMAVPMSAQALLVTVKGKQWSITAVTTSFTTDAALLDAQPWWNDEALAIDFAQAWGKADTATPSPFFAFRSEPPDPPPGVPIPYPNIIYSVLWAPGTDEMVDVISRPGDALVSYATATAVPLPAAVWLLLAGLGGLGLLRRRQPA